MRIGLILFLIIAIGIIVYSNSLGGDFLWDDSGFVLYNDLIKDLRFVPLYFTSKEALARGTLAAENYRPLLPLSYAIDYFFWKLNPLGYHISNLLFHIASAILVFYLVLLLTKNRFTGLLASLFFLTHPIATESVAWISGRADVLFLFFYLAALIAYINYTKTKRPLFCFASLMLFSCSLLSKEMAASLPLVIILYDLCYGEKEKITARAIRYLAFFLILEAYVIIRLNIIGKFAQCEYWTGDPYTTFLSMMWGIVYYIRLLIYPVGLCADYATFPTFQSIREPHVFLSIVAIFLLIAGAVKFRKSHKHISFSIFWFFITLLPASNIIPIKILIAERFLYLPSIGYCIMIAVLIMMLFEKFKETHLASYSIICFSVILICTYSYLTGMRNIDWSDRTVFYKRILEKYPDNHRARVNLSAAYFNTGHIDESYEEAKRILEEDPEGENLSARKIAALYYIKNDRVDDAIAQYRKILEIDPLYREGYMSLGLIYAVQRKYDLAYNEYKKALAADPDGVEAKVGLATIFLLKGDIDSGIREFNEILKTPPPAHSRSLYAAAYLRLGELYFIKGDTESALEAWTRIHEDFRDQIWLNEISKSLIGKIELEKILAKTKSWQPEFKILCYYYGGIKSEMDGEREAAKEYYRKSIDIPVEKWQLIKLFAANRLAKLEEESGQNQE